MRVATWNVNSIRARAAQVIAWTARNDVDVVLLQETKCTDDDFPFAAFSAAGYDVAHHGVDHWNGVAIVSRIGLADVTRGFTGHQRSPFDEARVMAATCGGVRLWSLYVPNGRELDDPHYRFKLVWLERLRAELAAAGKTPPPERTVAPEFPGPGHAIALHGDMVVHRAGPLTELTERISMVNGYVALDTELDEPPLTFVVDAAVGLEAGGQDEKGTPELTQGAHLRR